MFVIYPEAYCLHHPPFEIAEAGARLPMFGSPERMARLLEAHHQTAWAIFADLIGDLVVTTAYSIGEEN